MEAVWCILATGQKAKKEILVHLGVDRDEIFLTLGETIAQFLVCFQND
jgi:hypothetical protein